MNEFGKPVIVDGIDFTRSLMFAGVNIELEAGRFEYAASCPYRTSYGLKKARRKVRDRIRFINRFAPLEDENNAKRVKIVLERMAEAQKAIRAELRKMVLKERRMLSEAGCDGQLARNLLDTYREGGER